MTVPVETLTYRVQELERDVQTLNRKLDRLVWAIVSLTITIAASALGVAIAIASTTGSR